MILTICFLLFNFLTLITAHGRLRDPAARSTAWRVDSSYPAYYNDHEMFCGGAGLQWNTNGGKCSICGESFTANPKQFEKGGIYYTGRSIRTYKKGQTIDVHVELTANHLGWFEFRICNIDGNPNDATQECLDKTLLKDVNGLTRFPVQGSIRDFNYQIVLPQDLTCNQCVFQWKYHCGNSWGIDPATGKGCTGCSPEQEEFYGCSDVSITSDGSATTIPLTSRFTTAAPTTTRPIVTSIFTEPVTTQAVITTKIQSLTGKCPQGDIFYLDRSQSNCKNFYLCKFSGTQYETIVNHSCPEGLLFDEALKMCNWENKVICNLSPDTTTISPVTSSRSTITTSSAILLITSSSSSPIKTTTFIPNISSKCPLGDGTYPDLSTFCKRYFLCNNSGTNFETVRYYACGEGLLFDKKSNICNWSHLVDCEQKEDENLVISSTTTGIFTKTTDDNTNKKCNQGDGLYSDMNTDCENYYQCMFSGTNFERIINYSCPNGLRFDPTLKICNWAGQVACNF